MFGCGFLSTILIVLSALASIGLLLAANIGTIGDQMVKSSIFLIELDMQDLKTSSIISSGSQYTYTELGFANAYLFGMYGYCRGTEGTITKSSDNVWENVNFQNSNCTKSSVDYTFNPLTFAVDEINQYNTLGLTVDASQIQLPGGLNNYVNTASHLSQVVYICSIIAVCLTVLTILAQIFCCCYGSITFVLLLQFLAFVSAMVSSGAATGAFKYIETEFNKYGTTFGIHAQLSRNFLVLTWLGTGLSLFTIFLIIFTRCCCAIPGPSPSPVEKYDRIL
jgi:hypothetical protein